MSIWFLLHNNDKIHDKGIFYTPLGFCLEVKGTKREIMFPTFCSAWNRVRITYIGDVVPPPLSYLVADKIEERRRKKPFSDKLLQELFPHLLSLFLFKLIVKKWGSKISMNSTRFWRTSMNSTEFWRISTNFTEFGRTSKNFKELQRISKNYKELQRTSKNYKELQRTTKNSEILHWTAIHNSLEYTIAVIDHYILYSGL